MDVRQGSREFGDDGKAGEQERILGEWRMGSAGCSWIQVNCKQLDSWLPSVLCPQSTRRRMELICFSIFARV